jgi:hypothetical protein
MPPLRASAYLQAMAADLSVIYTDPEGTAAALATAGRLTKDLRMRIRVLAFQVVPPRVSMSEPLVSPEFAVNDILKTLGPYDSETLTLEYVLCRDKRETAARWVGASGTVIVGGRKRLLPSDEQRLATYLQNRGCEVIFVAVW